MNMQFKKMPKRRIRVTYIIEQEYEVDPHEETLEEKVRALAELTQRSEQKVREILEELT